MLPYPIRTQGIDYLAVPLQILPHGADPPTLGEGDPNGVAFKVARLGAGNIKLDTVDTFEACVSKYASIQDHADGDATINFVSTTKNADNTFSFVFTTKVAGVATDFDAALLDDISLLLVMRQSIAVP